MTLDDRTPAERATFLRDRIWHLFALSTMAERERALETLIVDCRLAFEKAEERGASKALKDHFDNACYED